jgi:hypothetical protein
MAGFGENEFALQMMNCNDIIFLPAWLRPEILLYPDAGYDRFDFLHE